MQALSVLTQSWIADDDGTTAIEYALMATLIASVIIPAVTQLGLNVESMLFGPVSGAF